MLHINYVDAEIIKDGTSHLVSKNDITGTSLEVLSFMVSGIEQSHHFNDGIDGRSRLFDGSEDKYRTVNLTVRMDAEYMQRVAHLRDSINQLFSGEFIIREMRIKQAEVAYESIGGNSGDMNLGTAEYVNGKQLKVTKVSPIEIADDRLSTDFTVELETTDLPYFESIYTTKELHDTGYDAAVAKYGLVDNIDADQTTYAFKAGTAVETLSDREYKNGSLSTGTGVESAHSDRLITTNNIGVTPNRAYEFEDTTSDASVRYWNIYEYDSSGNFIKFSTTNGSVDNQKVKFYNEGRYIKLMAIPADGVSLNPADIGTTITPRFSVDSRITNFSIWNAGNVTIEPEFMDLVIRLNYTYTRTGVSIKNITTGETFTLDAELNGSNVVLNGMNITYGSINGLRKSNRQRIKLVPGVNEFEIETDMYEEAIIDTKFYYR